MAKRSYRRGSDDDRINCGFHFGVIECRHFPKPTHQFNTIEIIYVTKGEGVCFAGDGITRFQPGDLFVFGANTSHYLKSAHQFYDPAYPLRCGAITLRFSEGVLPTNYNILQDCSNICRLVKSAELGVKWSSKSVDKNIISEIEAMEQRPGLERYICLLRTLNKLGLIVDKGEKIASERSEESLQSYDGAYRRVIEYISHNFHHNITLDELASYAEMNRTALCRHFRGHADRSIFDFLLEFRLNYTRTQLQSTNLPISDIAQSAGFHNLPNFNVQFKRATGCTPSEYRIREQVVQKTIPNEQLSNQSIAL